MSEVEEFVDQIKSDEERFALVEQSRDAAGEKAATVLGYILAGMAAEQDDDLDTFQEAGRSGVAYMWQLTENQFDAVGVLSWLAFELARRVVLETGDGDAKATIDVISKYEPEDENDGA